MGLRNQHADNLRRTRASMLGTDDEEHYGHCHDAASEIERLTAIEKAARETADQLRSMSGGVDGHLRNRICTAANRLDKSLGRQQSLHGEQF